MSLPLHVVPDPGESLASGLREPELHLFSLDGIRPVPIA